MKTTIKERKLANTIANLVLSQGAEGEASLPAVLEKVLAGRTPSEKRLFLQLLHQTFSREIHKDTLTIEHPGNLDEATQAEVTKTFQQNHPRPLRVETKENHNLIGGLRIQLGDSVYDASIAGKLNALASKVH